MTGQQVSARLTDVMASTDPYKRIRPLFTVDPTPFPGMEITLITHPGRLARRRVEQCVKQFFDPALQICGLAEFGFRRRAP